MFNIVSDDGLNDINSDVFHDISKNKFQIKFTSSNDIVCKRVKIVPQFFSILDHIAKNIGTSPSEQTSSSSSSSISTGISSSTNRVLSSNTEPEFDFNNSNQVNHLLSHLEGDYSENELI